MAKEKPKLEVFRKTEPEHPTQELPPDPVKPIGIGLKASEWRRMDEIAKDLGMKRHQLALWALRDFIRRYERGEIQTETKKTLPGA